jgi:transcriptional regulator CtsR
MHTVNAVGHTLNSATAQAIVENLMYQKMISETAARVLLAALSDQGYRDVPPEYRDMLRASLLKQMLTALIT